MLCEICDEKTNISFNGNCPLCEIKRLNSEHDRLTSTSEVEELRAENERLREAVTCLLKDAVILSDDYLDMFKDYTDEQTVQGWGVGRWRRLAVTAKKAEAALGEGRE